MGLSLSMSTPWAMLYTHAATAPTARTIRPKKTPNATRSLRRIEPRERRCRLRARCVMRFVKRIGARLPAWPLRLVEKARPTQRLVGVQAKVRLLIRHLGALAMPRTLELQPHALRRDLRD